MKRSILIFGISLVAAGVARSQTDGTIVTGISNHAQVRDASAVLEAYSDNQGFLTPRLTLVQRNAIASPATGLLIFQTDNTPGYYYNSGTPGSPVWERVVVSSGSLSGSGAATRVAFWSGATALSSNANLFWDNTNSRLGLSNATPGSPLHVGSTGWSANQIHFSSGWGAGGYHATIGSGYTGITAGGIMLGAPHAPYRSGFGAKVRYASDQSATAAWDFGINAEAGGALDRFDLNRNNVNLVSVLNNGNMGIGNDSPTRKLLVNGAIKLAYGHQIYFGENVTANGKIGVNFHTDADAGYWIGKPAGAWTQPLYVAFYTGIRIGANTAYGGTRFFNSSNMATQTMSTGDGDNHTRINYNLYAPILYDINDAAYYVDPNGTSNMNVFTRGTLARSSLNALQNNSPVTTRSVQGDEYRNGSMGWGQVDFNVMTNWGSGFIDSWSNPANAPGGSSHYTGLQSMHSTSQNSLNFYGFQFVTAGEAVNRYFLRNSWNVPRPWVEMIHTGNLSGNSILNQWGGNQSANFHISGSGRAGADLRAPIFYDDNNTGYYTDPNGVSNVAGITTSVNYNTFHTWTNLPNHAGVYSSNHNGAHFYPNDGSHGSWRITGSRNGWGGVEFPSGAGNISLMVNTGGWGGMTTGEHANSYGWLWRFEHQTLYASRIVDMDDGNFYMDPNSTSRMSSIYADGNMLNWPGYNGLAQGYGHYVWPGRNDGSGAAWQQSWYLASHSSYGLYTNTGLNFQGTLYAQGNTVIDAGGGWHRSYGSTGWFNGTYSGGWYMNGASHVLGYNNKTVRNDRGGYPAAAWYGDTYANGYWATETQSPGDYWYANYNRGYVYSTTYGYLSTRKSKKDIRKFTEDDYASALAFMDSLNLHYYVNRSDHMNTTRVGFIAEETPGNLTVPGKLGVLYGELGIYNTGAIRALKKKVEHLERQPKVFRDFGSGGSSSLRFWVDFSPDFQKSVGSALPAVILTSSKAEVVMSVSDVTNQGFWVDASVADGSRFSWIAMARVDAAEERSLEPGYSQQFASMLESAEYDAANRRLPMFSEKTDVYGDPTPAQLVRTEAAEPISVEKTVLVAPFHDAKGVTTVPENAQGPAVLPTVVHSNVPLAKNVPMQVPTSKNGLSETISVPVDPK